jgi:hypothetical protein
MQNVTITKIEMRIRVGTVVNRPIDDTQLAITMPGSLMDIGSPGMPRREASWMRMLDDCVGADLNRILPGNAASACRNPRQGK